MSLLVLIALTAWPAGAQTPAEPEFDGLELPGSSPAAPSSSDTPESDLAQLRELARYSMRASLTEAEEERSADLVERLAERRPVRRAVAHLLNRKGGKLDRWVNRALIRRAWKKHGPLPNLAEVTPTIVRGGQPSSEGFRRLRERGVRTIVNLRMEDGSERTAVEALGMTYVSIPIPDTEAPTREQAVRFLELCGESSSQKKLFFHCAAGVYRTGTMAGLYRISHGASAAHALEEAEAFGWRESWLNADMEAAFLRQWAAQSSFGRPPREDQPDAR